jgi:molybdopterin-containing oxidoreductase family membrane subunit
MAYGKKETEKKQEHHEHHGHTEEHFKEKHLMLDPLPRGVMNDMVMEAVTEKPSWKWWATVIIMGATVLYCLVYSWYRLIAEGVGIAGVNRPSYWGIFLVNTVFWIGISHAGTFISAI